MKKLMFVVLALFSLSAMTAQAVETPKEKQGRVAKMGKNISKNDDWGRYAPDPAFNYGIKAQYQRCLTIEETCTVLETYWLNGQDEFGKCTRTPVAIANFVNGYANLEHATKVLNRCEKLPEYVNIQYVFDPLHTGTTSSSLFFRWTFTVVRNDK